MFDAELRHTQFAEAAEANVPVMRPLFMEFPDDASLYTKEDAFLVGPALLVAPVLSKGQRSVAAQLPGQGVWYRLSTGSSSALPVDRKGRQAGGRASVEMLFLWGEEPSMLGG